MTPALTDTLCPFCGSTDFTGGSFDTEERKVTQNLICNACHGCWTAEYSLSAITRNVRAEEAAALGFASVGEMEEHQQWLDEQRDATLRSAGITDDLIDDILVTAFEGGIDYWLQGVRLDPSMPPINRDSVRSSYQMITQGYWIEVRAAVFNDGEWYRLTLDKVKDGLRLFLFNCPAGKGLTEDHDANDADAIVQYALWRDIIFS